MSMAAFEVQRVIRASTAAGTFSAIMDVQIPVSLAA